MNAFEARAVDEDLAQRTRQRQLVDTRAVELEGDGGFGLAVFAGLEEIRAEGLLRQVQILPDDAVFVEVADRLEPVEDAFDGIALGGLALAGVVGIAADVEQFGDQRR